MTSIPVEKDSGSGEVTIWLTGMSGKGEIRQEEGRNPSRTDLKEEGQEAKEVPNIAPGHAGGTLDGQQQKQPAGHHAEACHYRAERGGKRNGFSDDS